jgi:hypothetical protein
MASSQKNKKKEIGERGAHVDPFHSSNQSSPSTSSVVPPYSSKKKEVIEAVALQLLARCRAAWGAAAPLPSDRLPGTYA